MDPSKFAIPPGSSVLVTGANGYIASHIVDLLLELGFNVRGTVRSDKPWLNDFFDSKYGPGRFETVLLPDMDKEDAFAAAVVGMSGVLHTASDTSFSDDPERVIPLVQRATVNGLIAASKERSVKRFVLTSSSVAVIIPKPNVEGVRVDTDTWNDAVVDLAWKKTASESARGYVVYAASKTAAERSAWKWAGENKPGFVLNTVLPNCNYGKILVPEHMTASTMGFVRALFKGDDTGIKLLPPQYFIDVRDTARLHVAALLDGSIQNERVFGFAKSQNWTDVISILRKLRPGRIFPDPPVNEGRDLTEIIPRARALEILRSFFGVQDWTGLEESLAAGIEDLP